MIGSDSKQAKVRKRESSTRESNASATNTDLIRRSLFGSTPQLAGPFLIGHYPHEMAAVAFSSSSNFSNTKGIRPQFSQTTGRFRSATEALPWKSSALGFPPFWLSQLFARKPIRRQLRCNNNGEAEILLASYPTRMRQQQTSTNDTTCFCSCQCQPRIACSNRLAGPRVWASQEAQRACWSLWALLDCCNRGRIPSIAISWAQLCGKLA